MTRIPVTSHARSRFWNASRTRGIKDKLRLFTCKNIPNCFYVCFLHLFDMRGTGLVRPLDDDSLFQRVINPNPKQLLGCVILRDMTGRSSSD